MIAFSGVLQLVAHVGEEVRFCLACPYGLVARSGEFGRALPHKLLQTIVELLQADVRVVNLARLLLGDRLCSLSRLSSPVPGGARVARHSSLRGVSLGDDEPCRCPRPIRKVFDLDIGGLAEMSEAAADQTLCQGRERSSGPVGETQTSGPGHVTLERRQLRFRVQLAHLNVNVVFDVCEKSNEESIPSKYLG